MPKKIKIKTLSAVLIAILSLVACQTTPPASPSIENQSPAQSQPAPEPTLATTPTSEPGLSTQPAQDQIQITYAEPILQVLSNAFSPHGDGFRDTLDFYAAIPNTQGFKSWEIILLTEGNSKAVSMTGTQILPGSFSWNGSTPEGRPVPDGWYYGRLNVFYDSGKMLTSHSAKFLLWRDGPQARIQVPKELFSPDGDGINDTITINLAVEDPSSIISYQVTLYNSKNSVFETYTAPGAPPREFTWDGKNRAGDTVESAEDYRIELRMRDELGNTSITNATIPVDILVYASGDQLKIRISAITFLPYSNNFADVLPSERVKNLQTLDRLAEILKKFQGYDISIQGHAVMIHWNDPAKGAIEQRDILIPLSLARAEAIKNALVTRGVRTARMRTSGVGASQPIVPFADLENRWMNRRVEFILHR
jgi:outer membrane protein OmpA-like peptidoglycan-associated protein